MCCWPPITPLALRKVLDSRTHEHLSLLSPCHLRSNTVCTGLYFYFKPLQNVNTAKLASGLKARWVKTWGAVIVFQTTSASPKRNVCFRSLHHILMPDSIPQNWCFRHFVCNEDEVNPPPPLLIFTMHWEKNGEGGREGHINRGHVYHQYD